MSGTAALFRRYWPWLTIGCFAAVQAWFLRVETESVTPFRSNDEAIHITMIRWAADRIAAGHSPFDGWFPYLSFGSPQFHQYQSFPHVLAGVFAQVLDPEAIVQWSGFLLLAAWPVLMFVGIRMLTGDDVVALFAGVLAPLVSSADGFGYEYNAYVFRGFGLWANLLSMSLLPFAIALTWRVLERGRAYALTSVVVGITIVCHFMTGWLVLLWLGIAVVVGSGAFWSRVKRAAVVGVGSIVVASATLIPLMIDSKWIGRSVFLPSFLYDSYGARKVIGWLVAGRLFDAGHQSFPIVTVLVGMGIVVSITRWRHDALARTVLSFFIVSLVLYFGRPTFGGALDALPFTGDMVLHRLIGGVHLGGVLLAAIGATALVRKALGTYRELEGRVSHTLFVGLVTLVAVLLVAPAWTERADYLAGNRVLLHRQQAATRLEEVDLAAVIDHAKKLGGGRIYAGTPRNYGAVYLIGYATVYEELLWERTLGTGFIGRTASLSVDPEIKFQRRNPSHYPLFGVRYLILPQLEPKVPAKLIYERGRFRLFEVPDQRNYLGVYDSVGPAIQADRTDVGPKVAPYLHSDLPARYRVQPIAFAGDAAAEPTATRGSVPTKPPGDVTHERVRPDDGVFEGDVTTNRRAVVVLKESFHRRWEVLVDGKRRPTQMVTPSFVGVTVGPGTHHVEFRYVPFPAYGFVVLMVLAVVVLVALAVVPRYWVRRTKTSTPPAEPASS